MCRISDRTADVAAGLDAGETRRKAAAEPPDEPPGVLRPRRREAANGHALKDT
jgi:hypothetical protein